MAGARAALFRRPNAPPRAQSATAPASANAVTNNAEVRWVVVAVRSDQISQTATRPSATASARSRRTAQRSVSGNGPESMVTRDTIPVGRRGTVPPMRAVLVVNPKATTTSERSRDVLVRALRSEVDLSVRYTRRRGHAMDLAREAAEEGVDLVVTLGGDGTVNEVVNGLMAAEPPTFRTGDTPAERLPALATVPG